MRDAQQGFFDVAVNFEDVFCSAKLDTCYEGDAHIELLHGADSARDWTAVFGFACSAGADTGTDGPDTNLMYGRVRVTCGATVFELDPSLPSGNQSVDAGGSTLHYGIYRGEEALDCGGGPGSCNKRYWNLAFSLDDLAAATDGDCTLSFEATANDAASTGAFVGGVPAGDGRIYPFVTVNVPVVTAGVATCQRHALNTSAAVTTAYRGSTGGATAPVAMCYQFSGGDPTATGAAGCDASGGGPGDAQVIFADDFDRADGPIGDPWTSYFGLPMAAVASGEACGSAQTYQQVGQIEIPWDEVARLTFTMTLVGNGDPDRQTTFVVGSGENGILPAGGTGMRLAMAGGLGNVADSVDIVIPDGERYVLTADFVRDGGAFDLSVTLVGPGVSREISADGLTIPNGPVVLMSGVYEDADVTTCFDDFELRAAPLP